MYNCLLGALPSLDSGTNYLNLCISLCWIHSVILVAIAFHSQLWLIQLLIPADYSTQVVLIVQNVLVGSSDSIFMVFLRIHVGICFIWMIFTFYSLVLQYELNQRILHLLNLLSCNL